MSKGKKRFIILFVLSLAALTLVTCRHDRKSSFLFRALSYPYDVLNNLTSRMSTASKDHWNAFEENRRLKRDLTAALLEKQRCVEILQENKRLKELLSLKEHSLKYAASAKVIARGYDKLLHTMILDKGKNSGIKKDMAVITAKGLAGKIYSVKDDSSEVLLLRDPNFSAAVRLQNSRREGVVCGTGYRYSLLKYIPPEEEVEKGEPAVTSGLDGIFPPGLPVGVINYVRKEGIEFFQDIRVLPFQDDTTLEEVVVLGK
ncbi:MAG TPA: rod shape-determining protein MreC [Nitrospiraceae bacterium]|nr:rod shape-determining protein MreC [Nitrospiraceae bacterium]